MTTKQKVQIARLAASMASLKKVEADKRAEELKDSRSRNDMGECFNARIAANKWRSAEITALMAVNNPDEVSWKYLNKEWEKATGEKLFKEIEAVVFVAGRGRAAGMSLDDGATFIAPKDLIPNADRSLGLYGELIALNERKALEIEDASPVTDDSGWNAYLSHHPRCYGRKFRAAWFNATYASYCVCVMS